MKIDRKGIAFILILLCKYIVEIEKNFSACGFRVIIEVEVEIMRRNNNICPVAEQQITHNRTIRIIYANNFNNRLCSVRYGPM